MRNKMQPVLQRVSGVFASGGMHIPISQLFALPDGFVEVIPESVRPVALADRRLADPGKFAHIRQELGIDPVPDTDPLQE